MISDKTSSLKKPYMLENKLIGNPSLDADFKKTRDEIINGTLTLDGFFRKFKNFEDHFYFNPYLTREDIVEYLKKLNMDHKILEELFPIAYCKNTVTGSIRAVEYWEKLSENEVII